MRKSWTFALLGMISLMHVAHARETDVVVTQVTTTKRVATTLSCPVITGADAGLLLNNQYYEDAQGRHYKVFVYGQTTLPAEFFQMNAQVVYNPAYLTYTPDNPFCDYYINDTKTFPGLVLHVRM